MLSLDRQQAKSGPDFVAADALREVPGLTGIKVTADGRVWSSRVGRWLRPSKHSAGYLEVRVRQHGRDRNWLVHRLVAMAWVANHDPARFTQVNHIDGDKQNNAANNLEWCDSARNIQHAHNIGLNRSTDRQKQAIRITGRANGIFSESDVRAFRLLHASGIPVRLIAIAHGLERTTVSNIVHRHTYKHIT